VQQSELFTVTLLDVSGVPVSGQVSFKAISQPILDSAVPSSGAAGQSIVISGTRFSHGSLLSRAHCKFGDAQSLGRVLNDSAVSCIVPVPFSSNLDSIVGPVTLAISMDGGNSYHSSLSDGSSLTFSYVQGPTVSKVSMAFGTTAGGSAIVVEGANLAQSGILCYFGGQRSSALVAVNGSLGHCIVPSLGRSLSSALTVPLAVKWFGNPVECTGSHLDCFSTFSYLPSVRVTSIEPMAIQEGFAQHLSIFGIGFVPRRDSKCILTPVNVTHLAVPTELPARYESPNSISCQSTPVLAPGTYEVTY